MLKKMLVGMVVVVVLVLLVGWFLPRDFAMERSIVVNRPESQVHAYLASLKNQQEWSPWAKMDPKAMNDFSGEDGAVGSIHRWSGNADVGKGEQEVKNIFPGRIDIELRFQEPMEGKAQAYFLIEAIGENETKVTWGFSSTSKYPVSIMCFVMKRAGFMAKIFDQGLAVLKVKLEQ